MWGPGQTTSDRLAPSAVSGRAQYTKSRVCAGVVRGIAPYWGTGWPSHRESAPPVRTPVGSWPRREGSIGS